MTSNVSKGSFCAKIKDYQEKYALKNSELKVIWDENMDPTDTALAYHQAHVLLLSWHPDDDDLHVEQEVGELEDVFRNTFGYKTSQKVLRQNPEKHPQVQINFYLAEFVAHHDDQNTLLIVYYAGHGKLGDAKGVLNLTNSATINLDENKEIHEIVWNSAENIIRPTRSDVLVIFDCCNAGEMGCNVRGSDFTRRAFEYIAATSQSSATKKPGPKSFTSALIWALKEMIRCKPGKRFTTMELVEKIYNAPDIPKHQSPRLTERGTIRSLRKIVLAPLDEQHTTRASNGSMEKINEIKETHRVRFVFNKTITNRFIRDLSKDLSNLIGQGNFGTCTILWEGIDTPSPDEEQMLSEAGCTIWRRNNVQTVLQTSGSLVSMDYNITIYKQKLITGKVIPEMIGWIE